MRPADIRGVKATRDAINGDQANGMASLVFVSRGGRLHALPCAPGDKANETDIENFAARQGWAFVEEFPCPCEPVTYAMGLENLRTDAVNVCWDMFGLECDY